MVERVAPWDEDVRWDPNAAEAVLLSDEFGVTALALKRHSGDPDDRCVVLRWDGVRWASSSMPNDEARSGHPLWRKGLSEVLWAGIVEGSGLASELERRNRAHPRHDASWFTSLKHYVVLTKEETIEVVASSLTILRIAGSTLGAASAAVMN